MYTKNYPTQKTYEKYDDGHYMLYLGEQAVEFTPEHGGGMNEQPAEPEPIKGFAYTGDQPDGGTLVQAKEVGYGEFVSGLIRKQYPEDAVEAVQNNLLVALKDKSGAKAAQYKQEFDDYNAYRAACKESAKKVLGLQ
ncbi:MAG: hypothetical protein LBU42_04230 [Prevotellaceae bacterium]|jgi:hypothetical protein|nr:hypothetical protein [Prevotellaceae bacterium]